jgi:hypothetical protein
MVVAITKIAVDARMVVTDAATEDVKEGAASMSSTNFVAKKDMLS